MKLYIAGPMTGLPDCNFPAFNAMAAQLREKGHLVISPAETFGAYQGALREDYGRYDIAALLQVEGIVLLPRWDHSLGARTEVSVGLWLDLKFFVMTQYGLNEILPDNPCRPTCMHSACTEV